MSERVLITGADGQLARALAHSAPPGVECAGRSRPRLDICDSGAVAAALCEVRPSLVVNGAAYNQVDRAENEGMEDALRVNALGVGLLAEACRRAGIPLVHFSTDLVFSGQTLGGQKRTPYTEEDPTGPLGVYGASKLAGENIALAADSQSFVIRVGRLFGPAASPELGSAAKPSGNFPRLMLRLARERGQRGERGQGGEQGHVRVVNDQIGTPTFLPDLARSVWRLVLNAPGGLYQIANAGEVSFADYAREIFRLAGIACVVEAVSSTDYGAAARRPLYSVMSSAKAHAAGVAPLRPWQSALAGFIAESLAGADGGEQLI